MKKGLWERFLRRQAFKRAIDFLTATEDGSLDHASFAAWLLKHPRNARTYLVAWSKDREMSRLLRESRSPRSHGRAERAGIAAAITPSSSRRRALSIARSARHPARRGVLMRRVIATAAGIAILSAVIRVAWTQYAPYYETLAGETRVAILPDGSRAHLNGHTRLRVWMHGRRREIELVNGEAFFDVVHDPVHPFRVTAHGAVAVALGTQFEVRLDGAEQLAIIVKQGRVAVLVQGEATPRSDRVVIRNSQAASVRLGRENHVTEVEELTKPELRRSLSWTESVTLNGTPLSEVVERFNRANVRQIIIDDHDLASVRVSGSIPLIEPETFVDMLRDAHIAAATESPLDGVFRLSRPPLAAAGE